MVSPARRPPFEAPLHDLTLALRDLMLTRPELDRWHARALGVNELDYRALGMLLGQGPVTPGAMAEELGISRTTTSNVIARLVEAGHATTLRDPADRRHVLVSATQASRTRALETMRPVIERSESMVAAMTPEQAEAVGAFLGGVLAELTGVLSGLRDPRT